MKLYGNPGWGSAIVSYQLVWYGMEHQFVTVGNLFEDPDAEDELRQLNPLRQIPTLVMDDGSVMSESAAITLLLADMAGNDSLVPLPGSDERAEFLRWLVFMVANIYPTYTYVDLPSRFVADEAAQTPFVRAVHDYARRLYQQLDTAVAGPWFLGERFSALDIYVANLTRWTPGREWHSENCPKLNKITERIEALPELADVVRRNNA